MATTTLVLSSTCKAVNGGVDVLAATNQLNTAVIGGAFAAGEKIGIELTDAQTAKQTLIGAGNITAVAPVFVFVFDAKVYFLAGSTVYFSAINAGTTFNDKNGTGNAFVSLANTFGTAEDVVAIALQQGKLVFFARRTTQIWAVDADPDNWAQSQVLQNCGTVAGKSVLAMGELEVFFVMDSGIRSLRARETTLNAFLADIGSPIDELVVAKLATCSATDLAGIRAVNEPTSGRSWFFIKDTIYVLSYFQSAQIIAWSKYLPTYESAAAALVPVFANGVNTFSGLTIGANYQWTKTAATGPLVCGSNSLAASGYFVADATTATATSAGGSPGDLQLLSQVAFTPTDIAVLDGQVFCRDTDSLYAYGGTGGNNYDSAVPQWDIPFLDCKSPAAGKKFNGIDVAMEGNWSVYLGTNINDETDVKLVYKNGASSYASAKSLVMRRATHFKLRGIGSGRGYCRFSKTVLHFEPAAEK